jgi:DNA repair photolyase
MLTKIPLSNVSELMTGKLLAYNSLFKTWSIEHYSKCSFRCAYCCFDSQGNSVSTVDPDKLITLLADDIHNAMATGLFVPKKTKIILSCYTDPYVDLENTLLLTRRIISHLVAIDQPFIIGTRGDLIQRDIDLLKNYRDACSIHFSLPVIDPVYIKKFEPHVPATESRINAIWSAYDAGISITVRIDPWIPGATDVEAILQCLPENIDILVSPLMLADVFKAGDSAAAQIKMGTSYNEVDLLFNKNLGFLQKGFCQTATKLFSHLSQSSINNEYIKERNRVGFRPKVKWYYPPTPGKGVDEHASRFLKPGELSPMP